MLKKVLALLSLAALCAGVTLQEAPAGAAAECPAGNTKWAQRMSGSAAHYPANCRISWCYAYGTTYDVVTPVTFDMTGIHGGVLVAKYRLVNGTAPSNNCPEPIYSSSGWVFP